MIEEDLIVLVNDVTELTMYPDEMEQDVELPGITYRRVTTERRYTHSGSSGLAKPRFQLDLWDATYLGVRQLANTLRIGIDGYHGTLNGRYIGSIMIVDEQDAGEEDATGRYRVIMDVEVDHNEEVS